MTTVISFQPFDGTPDKYFRYVKDVMLLMDEREYNWLFDRTSNPYPQYPRAEYRRIKNRYEDHYDRRAVKDYNKKCWKLDRQIASAITLFRRTFSSSVDDSFK